jgi:hypothetical protein
MAHLHITQVTWFVNKDIIELRLDGCISLSWRHLSLDPFIIDLYRQAITPIQFAWRRSHKHATTIVNIDTFTIGVSSEFPHSAQLPSYIATSVLAFRRYSARATADAVSPLPQYSTTRLMIDPGPYNLKKDYAGSLVTRTWLSPPWCDYGRHTLS